MYVPLTVGMQKNKLIKKKCKITSKLFFNMPVKYGLLLAAKSLLLSASKVFCEWIDLTFENRYPIYKNHLWLEDLKIRIYPYLKDFSS